MDSESKPFVKTIITDDPETTEIGIFKKITTFLVESVRGNRDKAQNAAGE